MTSHQHLSFSKLITKFQRELLYHVITSKSSDFTTAPNQNRKKSGYAQLWAKEHKTNLLQTKRNNIFLAPSSTLLKELKLKGGSIMQTIQNSFELYDSSLLVLFGENFDKFIHRRKMFRKLQKVTEDVVQTFTCNCKTYLQTVTCKHSLGMCILHNLVIIIINCNYCMSTIIIINCNSLAIVRHTFKQ